MNPFRKTNWLYWNIPGFMEGKREDLLYHKHICIIWERGNSQDISFSYSIFYTVAIITIYDYYSHKNYLFDANPPP